MNTSNDGIEAAISLLAGRGHKSWRLGQAALAAVRGDAAPPYVELVTDAPAAVCAEVLATVRELAEGHALSLEPLGGVDLSELLLARGITLDAIAVDTEGNVTDPTGGLRHLDDGLIRTLRPPDHAFREQPGLLMRLARVIASTGLRPSSELHRFACRDNGNILDVTDRRRDWGANMNGLLLGPHVAMGLEWLEATGVLSLLLPEIAAMIGFDKTCAVHHKDIWDHTKIVTGKAAPDLVVRWAALCHDIGKVWTRAVNKSGKVHFFRHEEHGALLFEAIAHRFELTGPLTFRVRYLIQNHSRVNLYADDWTDSAVRRLIRQTEGHLHDLLTFSKADYTTRRESRIRQMQRTMAELEARIAHIRAEDAKQPPLSKGIGNAIIEHFQLRPSRLIGDLKTLLENAIDTGELPERSDDDIYLKWLRDSDAAMEKITAARGQKP